MPKQENDSPRVPDLPEDILSDAKAVAEAGDSLFVDLARNLGKAVRWGKDELFMVADSAKCAAKTTSEVTNKAKKKMKHKPNIRDKAEELLEQLGTKVASHEATEYGTLVFEEEFWQLVKQLGDMHKKVKKSIAKQTRAQAAAAKKETDESVAPPEPRTTAEPVMETVEAKETKTMEPEAEEPELEPEVRVSKDQEEDDLLEEEPRRASNLH